MGQHRLEGEQICEFSLGLPPPPVQRAVRGYVTQLSTVPAEEELLVRAGQGKLPNCTMPLCAAGTARAERVFLRHFIRFICFQDKCVFSGKKQMQRSSMSSPGLTQALGTHFHSIPEQRIPTLHPLHHSCTGLHCLQAQGPACTPKCGGEKTTCDTPQPTGTLASGGFCAGGRVLVR